MILEPRKIKSDTVSTVSPSISHEVKGPDDPCCLIAFSLENLPIDVSGGKVSYYSHQFLPLYLIVFVLYIWVLL